jgi:hypothetical protein
MPLALRFRCFLAAILLAACCAPPAAAQSEGWPQWRGPRGLAVSSATGLPVDLSPGGPAMRWKVAVPGEGHSSPIVSKGRVFLTTAYPGEVGASTRLLKTWGITGALLLALLAALSHLRRRSRAPAAPPPRGLPRLLLWLDAAGVLLVSAGFAGAALAANFRPELFWPPGQPGEIWCVSGTLACAGIAAGIGWLRPGSWLRLLLCVPMLAFAA